MLCRGKGNVQVHEALSYHDKVVVRFQKKAYMDTDTLLKWIEFDFAPYKQGLLREQPILMLSDNLAAQRKPEVVQAFRDHAQAEIGFGFKYLTHRWQPIDQGWGQLWKQKLGWALENWIEESDEHRDKWDGCKYDKWVAQDGWDP